MNIRSDFIFSYWIFTWFILYILKIIPYSPKFIIILGLIEVFFALCYLLYYQATFYKITKFIIINIIIKVIPLYIIWNSNITKNDIILSIILIVIYLSWIFINKINLFLIYKSLTNGYLSNKKSGTYFSNLYDYIFTKYIFI